MWQSKVKLNQGEELKHVKSVSKGSMAQEDISEYSVVNSEGQVVGTVIYKDHMALRGFGRTQSVEQVDINRKLIVDESWSD
ncbi:MAG: hypothetical protein KIC49_23125 [Pseudomonas fluorescens]|jgi:hypothetical protein|nr:hypothetical protein [Pseudomonas fluorescens]